VARRKNLQMGLDTPFAIFLALCCGALIAWLSAESMIAKGFIAYYHLDTELQDA
jgi:hypothetical protein